MFAKGALGNSFFFKYLCLFRGNKAGDMTAFNVVNTTTQLGMSTGG